LARRGGSAASSRVKSQDGTPAPVSWTERLHVDAVFALGDDAVLVYGWAFNVPQPFADLRLTIKDATANIADRCQALQRADVSAHFASRQVARTDLHGFLAIIRMGRPIAAGDSGRIALHVEAGVTLQRPLRVKDPARDIARLMSLIETAGDRFARSIASLGPPHADIVRSKIGTIVPQPWSGTNRHRIFGARLDFDGLPAFVRSRIDTCVVVQGQGMFLRGWLFDPTSAVVVTNLLVGNLTIGDVLKTVRPEPRPDLADLLGAERTGGGEPQGFLAFVPLSMPVPLTGCYLEYQMRSGDRVVIRLAPADGIRPVQDLLVSARSYLLLYVEALAASRLPGFEAAVGTVRPQLGKAVAGMPASLDDDGRGIHLFLDVAIAVPGQGVFLTGWAVDERHSVAAIELVSIAGTSCEMRSRLVPIRRYDVRDAMEARGTKIADPDVGFVCFCPLHEGRGAEDPSYLCLLTNDGERLRLRVARRDGGSPEGSVRKILGAFAPNHQQIGRIMIDHVGPAVAALERHRPPVGGPLEMRTYGVVPAGASTSIVIPLFGRIDVAEVQLALMAGDPDLKRSEIAFVLDDPDLLPRFLRNCPDWAEMFGLPFRTFATARNLGFAAAVNAAAARVSGERLLIMHSDVLPRAPGWLGRLETVHAEHFMTVGAVGPKLLYPDGSIQHAGIRFVQPRDWQGLWAPDSALQGQPDRDDGRKEAVRVNAVSGACMMIGRELFLDHGGLSRDYLDSSAGDIDLCLRLADAGHTNWYVPAISLFHAGGMSRPKAEDPDMLANIALYDTWKYSHRWQRLFAQAQGR
jgi:GT2 family glycosyltransferase